jgi:hypothetical protein
VAIRRLIQAIGWALVFVATLAISWTVVVLPGLFLGVVGLGFGLCCVIALGVASLRLLDQFLASAVIAALVVGTTLELLYVMLLLMVPDI